MAISKITNAERDEVKIYGLPDKPGLSKEAMQQRFDGLGNLAIDKINEVIDSVNDSAKEVKELGDKVDQFGEGQIPEEYLQQSVDNYIANNQSGLATKTDVTNLDSKLSSEIADVEEDLKHVTPSIHNLVDKDKCVTNGRIGVNGIEVKEGDTCTLTDFIRVKPNTVYFKPNTAYVGYYTREKVWLGRSVAYNDSWEFFKTPINCHYIVTYEVNELIDSFMVVESESEVTDYIPFRENAYDYLESEIKRIDNKNTSRCANKKVAFVGDSFVDRANYEGYYSYVRNVTNILGCDTLNYGKAGTGYMRTYGSDKAYYNRVSEMSDEAEYIIVSGIVNDFDANSERDGSPLGEITDTGVDTVTGCIKKCFENLLTKYPTKKIGVVTSSRIASLSKKEEMGYVYGRDTNAYGLTLEDYVNRLIEVCKMYSIPCLDLFHLCGFNDFNIDLMTDDGLHPNELGCEFISVKIAEFIENL